MYYRIGARSDVGKRRRHNQDSIFEELQETAGGPVALLAVADGMGGLFGGEVASRTAIATIREDLERHAVHPNGGGNWEAVMRRSFARSRETFKVEIDRDRDLQEMGTTLTCLAVAGYEAAWAHAGDSRLYLYRDNQLQKLTTDHTVAQDLLLEGKITPEEVSTHQSRNVLTLWLAGDGAYVNPETSTFEVRAGDICLLCSDGLHTMVPDSGIAAVLAALPAAPTREEMDGAAARLVDLANESGGADNISAVLVRCIENFPQS